MVNQIFVEESKHLIRFLDYKTLNGEVEEDGFLEFDEDEFFLYLKEVEGVGEQKKEKGFQSIWDTFN